MYYSIIWLMIKYCIIYWVIHIFELKLKTLAFDKVLIKKIYFTRLIIIKN